MIAGVQGRTNERFITIAGFDPAVPSGIESTWPSHLLFVYSSP